MKDSEYSLKSAVWEITALCNMRCKHCIASCGDPKHDELTTQEALDLCDQLIDIGVEHITFSGGEPFMRKDWPIIAERLTKGGITVNAISNGWFIDEEIIHTALKVGMPNMAVSLDGSEKVHDDLRVSGSFKRVIHALDLLQKMGMPSAVCTTLNNHNLKDLPYLKEILIEKKVGLWQIQITAPEGNALDHDELFLSPEDLSEVLDFFYETMKEKKFALVITDNIGYFDVKSMEIMRDCSNIPNGDKVCKDCEAGKSFIDIRCNGDITPCPLIRGDDFVEGNIRDSTLRKIWNRPGAFSWNRDMTTDNLTGFCSECQYSEVCLGGCPLLKKTDHKDLYENKYCLYRSEFMKESEIIEGLTELDDLLSKGRELVECCQYEAANKCLNRIIQLYPDCPESVDLLNDIKHQFEESA